VCVCNIYLGIRQPSVLNLLHMKLERHSWLCCSFIYRIIKNDELGFETRNSCEKSDIAMEFTVPVL
jgi:hypothetical protein